MIFPAPVCSEGYGTLPLVSFVCVCLSVATFSLTNVQGETIQSFQ